MHVAAIALVALAAGVRWVLDPWLGLEVPYATFLVAVGAAVWLGGWRAGATACAASVLVVLYVFLPPRFGFGWLSAQHFVGLATFAASSFVLIAIGESMWAARRRLAGSREQLAASEEFHRLIAGIGTDFAWTARFDPERGLVLERATQGLARIVDRAVDEMFELDWVALIHPDDRSDAEQRLERVRRGEGVEGEMRILRRDGAPTWIHYVARPTTGAQGEVRGMIGAGRSIDDAKRAEERNRQLTTQLEERVAELETLLEILPVGVWQGDATCEHITGNRAAYDLLRLPVGANVSASSPEVLAGSTRLGYRVVAAGRELRPDELPMQRTARTGEPVHNVSLDLVFDEGQVRSLLCNVAPLLDERGHVRAVLGAYAEVTEQVRAERELREADRRKDEFLATLAHELRNPLAPIRSATAVLQLVAGDEGSMARPLAVIDRQVAHMARLLDDLLDVSRITRNKLELRREPVPLASIVSAAVEAARPAIEAGHHELVVSLPDEALVVDGDPVRLAQVFTNLLTNSAKYTDRGGHIALRAAPAGDEVVVTVEDDGIGIAPEMLPRIFEMFAQDQPALQRAQGGLGIGLSLVRALVVLHGGRVEAHSEGVGRGTRMVVRLPLAKGPPVVDTKERARPSPGRRLRVLVADDNADAAETLAMFLSGLGHSVRTARDGVEALAVAEEQRPELVLLDLGMPRMNGLETARAMRETPWGRAARIVAVTGWGHSEDRRRTAEARFDDHLVKPVELRELRAIVDALAGSGAESVAPHTA